MRDNKIPVYVYILQSGKDQSYYCGHTYDLRQRLGYHNQGYNKSTRSKIPWKLVHAYLNYSRVEAMKLENRIKKRGIGRFLKDLNKSR